MANITEQGKNKMWERVPNRFFGIRDLACLKPWIRDFGKKWGARFEIVILNGTRDLAI